VRTADDRDVLLDEALGSGFALLVRGPRAEAALPALNAAPFAALAARIVLMRPEGGDVNAPAGVTVVHDIGPPSPRLAELSDHIILLRPDRYVAACMAVDELETGGDAVGKLIASTFTG
jgi:3-(3-hydroxy-phenyl)propionate hydroxylase